MRAIVLLSGGMDSTICLHQALIDYDHVRAISFHYGQRNAAELEAAKEIAAMAKVNHSTYAIPAIAQLADSALIDPERSIEAAGGLEDSTAPSGLPTSYVPGRNILFLALAGAAAVKCGARDIILGVRENDSAPDCHGNFIIAMQGALTLGMPTSCGPIRLNTPLRWQSKVESIRLAERLPGCWEALALSITCYLGRRPGCGDCPACRRRADAFRASGLVDPAG